MHNASPPEPRPAFIHSRSPVSISEAIYARRATRDYTSDPVPEAAINALLYAAVQAPTAMREHALMFAVIQDRAILKALSGAAGAGTATRAGEDFNIFYNAGTLIVIYAEKDHRFVPADCWLAAENLMLLACGMGLGTCVIGNAVDALNTAEWKQRLKVSDPVVAIAPVIVGTPATRPEAITRQPPRISRWIES